MNGGLRGYIDSYKVDEEMLRAIPVGRVAIVAETAKLVRFLLSEDASYIAGQNVSADSGLTPLINSAGGSPRNSARARGRHEYVRLVFRLRQMLLACVSECDVLHTLDVFQLTIG